MKDCKRCLKVKSFSEFRENKNNKDGFDSYCSPCRKEYQREYHAKTYVRKFTKEKMVDGKHLCTICNEYKDPSNFHESNKSWCKPCKTEYSRKRNESKTVHPRKYLDGKINCRHCKEYFSEDEMYKAKNSGYDSLTYCKTCKPIVSNMRQLKKYSITVEQYMTLLESQGGVCKLCKKEDSSFRTRLSVDHDHSCCPNEKSCGKCIRGLLCHHCNITLGAARDDIQTLQNMIDYLKSGYVEVK